MIAERGEDTFTKGKRNDVMKIANAITRVFVQNLPLVGDGFSEPRFILKTFILTILF